MLYHTELEKEADLRKKYNEIEKLKERQQEKQVGPLTQALISAVRVVHLYFYFFLIFKSVLIQGSWHPPCT